MCLAAKPSEVLFGEAPIQERAFAAPTIGEPIWNQSQLKFNTGAQEGRARQPGTFLGTAPVFFTPLVTL